MQRQTSPGLDVIVIPRAGFREVHATVRPLPGEAPADTLRRLGDTLRRHDAAVVKHDVFGSLAAHEAARDALRDLTGGACPVTWIEGETNVGRGIDGMHVVAVSGTPVETIRVGGRPVGRGFDDGRARHVLFGDVRAADTKRSAPDQACETFDALEAALRAAGLDFSRVVRTWLFLDGILAWYGPFNAVRTAFFRKRRVFDGLVPASTGVGGRNPAGAAVAAAAWAVQPRDGSPGARELPSPLQCPAPKYGSSFSRAVELAAPDCRRVLVSGTASIAPDGSTARIGDVQGQVALTMDVVRAILVSRGLDFADVTRAIVYFKDPKDFPRFAEWAAAHGSPAMPLVTTPTPICRDDLLFEVELDAVGPPD